MTTPTVAVAIRIAGRFDPVCLDCAAAVGGKRYKLRKRQHGKPCPSCVEMEADRRYEEEQAAGEAYWQWYTTHGPGTKGCMHDRDTACSACASAPLTQ